MNHRRILLLAAVVAVVAYCIDNVRHAFTEYDRQAKADEMIATIRQTAPGWRR